MKITQILLLTVFFFAVRSEAKVFDFKNSSFGAFVGGTYGPSMANDSAFAGSSGDQVTFDRTEESNYSGEFGFLMSSQRINFKLYAEYLFPKHLTAINATDKSGNALYTLDSQVTAFVPTAVLEIAIKTGATWRWLVAGGYGYAIGNLSNKYTFTSAGKTKFGLSDYEETGSVNSSMYLGYTAIEFKFTDIATMMLDVGYRYLTLSNFTNASQITGFNGSQAAGSTLTNSDGSPRSSNLSGPYAGVSFRFYFF